MKINVKKVTKRFGNADIISYICYITKQLKTMDIIKDLLIAMDKGVDFTCNSSPTCRAKVVNVFGNGTTVLEVVKHPESYMEEYNVKHSDTIGKTFTLPSQWAWNAIYF